MSRKQEAVIYDPLKMFVLAQEFLRACRIMANAQRGATDRGQLIPSPNIMAHAFSLELYLKCLYVLDHKSGPPRIHNLKVLFDALLPDTQTKLRNYFDPTEGQRFLDDLKRRHQGKVLWNAPVKFDFNYALTASSNAFEYIRYGYERAMRSTERWCGTPLVNAAQRLILEMNPMWLNVVEVGQPMEFYTPAM
jgi:hypothetical protein